MSKRGKKIFTIKTKYAVGDTVYVIVDDAINKTKITDIYINFEDNIEFLGDAAVQYDTKISTDEVEETLFKTKKEAQEELNNKEW